MGKWMPVDFLVIDKDDNVRIFADEIAMTIGKGDTALDTIIWPEDGNKYALCRLVPDEGSVPVESIRICASYGMPLGVTYAEYNAARDNVLAWLAQQQKGGE